MFDRIADFIRDWYGMKEGIPLHAPSITQMDKDYVADAIDSTFVSSVGRYVDDFEKIVAEQVGVRRAIAVVNGTSALHMALLLAGVRQGDEVIMQPLTFVATANAAAYLGAEPVFVDVDRSTLGMSPEALEEFLSENCERTDTGDCCDLVSGRRVAAVVPMHTFGHPCRMEEIADICQKWGLILVEDAAEALGSYRNGKACGKYGQSGIFSFNGNKVVTCGGGGAIVTDDETLADRAKHLTTTAKSPHPWEYIHDEVGYNYRLPNLNAAMAVSQLSRLNRMVDEKRMLAQAYASFFADFDSLDFVEEPEGCRSNYWLNAIIWHDAAKRDEFLRYTNERSISTRPIWQLMCDLGMYRHCRRGSVETARWLAARVVNLPSSVRFPV